MSKPAAIALIIAGVCLLLGIVSMGIGIRFLGKLPEIKPGLGAADYDITEQFDGIFVDSAEFDISVLPSADGQCHVKVHDGSTGFGARPGEHRVSVVDGTLTVRREKSGWFPMGFFWGEQRITVLLPEGEYGTLTLKTASGDISVDAGASRIANASLHSASGDLNFAGTVDSHLAADTASGDISLKGLAQNVKAKSTSGEIFLNCTAEQINVKSTSGDVQLTSLRCDDLQVKTTSGEVKFSDLQALQTNITTTSGDVTGSLKNTKFFDVHTTSGSVNVPHSQGADGDFKVETTSGDVNIWVE